MSDRLQDDLISIIITNYNYSQFIGKAIDSIFRQTYPRLELIIIDDGSVDDSMQVIKSRLAAQSRKLTVRTFSHENRGIVSVRNEGLDLAQGTYFAFLDADDFFDEDYIERMYEVAVSSGADVVYPNWRVTDQRTHSEYKTDFPVFDIRDYQLQKLHVSAESFVKRSSVRGLRFRSEKVAEDWDFFNRMALEGASFELAADCYINYLVKPDGRGEKNAPENDIAEFERLLGEWRQEYGLSRVIPPFTLFEAKYREVTDLSQERLVYIRQLEKTVREFDAQVKQQEVELMDLHQHIDKLKAKVAELDIRIQELISSHSYRFGNACVRFLHLFRHPSRIIGAVRRHLKLGERLRQVRLSRQLVCRRRARRQNNYKDPRRVLIFAVYADRPRLSEYKLFLLRSLAGMVQQVLIVVNGELGRDDLTRLQAIGRVEVRENVGYDTAAFKYGIQLLEDGNQLRQYDQLLLVNDTLIGPVLPLQPMFEDMAAQRLDFWGICYGPEQQDFTGYNPYGKIGKHLQSFFLVCEKSLFNSPQFSRYWDSLKDTDSRFKAIGRHETVFTRHFGDLGFTFNAFCGEGDKDSGMYIHPLTMIEKYKVPFIKYSAFANVSSEDFEWQGLERESEVPQLLKYLRSETSYPVRAIVQVQEQIRQISERHPIVIIDGVENAIPQCTRYRVTNKAEQLRSHGYEVDVCQASVFELKQAQYASFIIIYRAGWSEKLEQLCHLAHREGKPIFYDIDDLVFDTKYTDQLSYVKSLSKQEKSNYDAGVEGYGKMLSVCDGAITTTSALSKELKAYTKRVLLNRNLASQRLVDLSAEHLRRYQDSATSDPNQLRVVRIGFFSGSIVHNENLEMITDALVDIMNRYPQVELHLNGYLDLPHSLELFKERIILHPYTDWTELPALISEVDINLAPLVDTVFNRAKSEIKWIEAALVKVPTLASDIGSFQEMIKDGETGFLAAPHEWRDKIEYLITHPRQCAAAGERAYAEVLEHNICKNKVDELTREIDAIYHK